MNENGSNRFASISSEQLQNLQEHQQYSDATIKATKYGTDLWNKFLSSKSMLTRDFVCASTNEQDDLLSAFFASVRKNDGELLKKMSYDTLKYSLARYLRESLNINLFSSAFIKTSHVFKNMATIMKKCNKGVIDHHVEIIESDLQKVFNQINIMSPQELQWYVFIIIHLHLCKRGGENAENYTKTTFQTAVDSNGLEYIFQADDLMTKNNRESITERKTEGRIYAQPNWKEKCPLNCFKLYLSKLSSINRLWQKPKSNVLLTDSQWYFKQPIGKNYVYQFMTKISTYYRLSKSYTNHCLRVSSITILGRSFSENDIKKISGHNRTSSLHCYKRLNDHQKRDMAQTLSNAFRINNDISIDETIAATSSSLMQSNSANYGDISTIIIPTEKVPATESSLIEPSKNQLDTFADMPILQPEQPYTDSSNTIDQFTMANQQHNRNSAPVFYNCSNFTVQFHYH